MALGDSGPAPYAPAPRVLTVVETARDKGLQTPVNAAVLQRMGVEESLVNRTLSALRQLDLLDDGGNPTATMDKIRKASTADYQTVLADWLRSAYAPIFQYVEPTDPVERIADQFRHYEPTGMRNRMVTLFIGLCVAAGLVEEKPKMPRPTRTSAKTTPPGKPKQTSKPDPKPKDEVANPAKDNDAGAVRDRYVEFLIGLAEKSDTVDPDLLDRIERALGIQGAVP